MTALGAGTGIAAGIYLTYSHRTSFILELIKAFNAGLFLGTRHNALVPCTTGFAGFLLSNRIVQSPLVQSGIRNTMLTLFKQMSEIPLKPHDLDVNRLVNQDAEIRPELLPRFANDLDVLNLSFTMDYIIDPMLNTTIFLIQDPTLFDAALEQQALLPILNFFQNCRKEENKNVIIQKFINYLKVNHGDLISKFRNAGLNVIKTRLIEELTEEVKPVFYDFMRQAYGPQLIISNGHTGYRLLLVLTLKDQLDSGSQALDQLVHSFIADCRHPNGLFVSQVRNAMLFEHMPRLEKPLDIFSLIDPDLNDAAWNQICESYSSRFQERGLTVSFQDVVDFDLAD